jgi:hypothetical protein
LVSHTASHKLPTNNGEQRDIEAQSEAENLQKHGLSGT